jgi:hypothetical protein
VVYSAALSEPSHVFSKMFFFSGGTTKIIFHTQRNPPPPDDNVYGPEKVDSGERERLIAGSRIELLRNYCLDDLFVKSFLYMKVSLHCEKKLNHVYCLLFGIYMIF